MKKSCWFVGMCVNLLFITSCAAPEKLVEQSRQTEQVQVIESFGDEALIIDLDCVAVKLTSITMIEQETSQALITLQVRLDKRALSAEQQMTEETFAITAQQGAQELACVAAPTPFFLGEAGELIYQFKLNSATEAVYFSFMINTENVHMTKHYQVFLE